VLVGNTTYFSSTNRFSFSAPNGSYGYYVPRPRGYAPTFDAGAAYVNGSDPVVNISFVPTYTITFNETGLPSGMTWGGTIVPWQNSSSSNSFTLLEPNGTYHYTLNPVPGFTTLWEGTVQVAGSNTTVSVVFAATTYAVQFAESGLPVGAGWSVVIDGISKPANSSILQVLLPNGSYRFVIPSVGGFYPGPASGSVEVAGNGTTVQVQFLFTYAVTFQETGLAPGTSWTLKVGGVAHTAEASAIVLNEPNGTFGYTIDPIRGYFAAWSGSVQVAGENLSVPVPFTLVTYALQFMATGLPPGTFWSVVVDGVDHPTSGSSLLLEEPNGTYTVTYSPSGPYSLLNEPPALVQVNGGGFNVTVAYGLTFDLAFVESGLPFATAWTVSVILTGSLTQISGNSSTATISFQEPNGSYAYTPGAQPGFFTPARGTANLRGSDVTVSIVYAPYTYPVLFNQSGLPARTAWNVSIEGTTYGSTSSTLTVSLPIGVHDYLIVPLPGYRTTWTGQVTVSGRPASVNVTFTTLTYPLLIEEIGLAPGTPWGIEVGNLSVNTSSSSTTIQLANGTYAYTPSPVAGYEVPGSGSIGVEGTLGGRLVVVYSSPASSATLFDLPPAEGYAVVLGLILVSVAAIAAAAFAFRSRRPGS